MRKEAKKLSVMIAGCSIALCALTGCNDASSDDQPKSAEVKTTTEKDKVAAMASQYLIDNAYSEKELAAQLQRDGYPEKKVTAAIQTLNIDWNEQAVKAAETVLIDNGYSEKGLIEQLQHYHFTKDQAAYAVKHIDVNWNEQAIKTAKTAMIDNSYSEEGLIEQLQYYHFTKEQAVYAVKHIDADWNEQAVKAAETLLTEIRQNSPSSRNGVSRWEMNGRATEWSLFLFEIE